MEWVFIVAFNINIISNGLGEGFYCQSKKERVKWAILSGSSAQEKKVSYCLVFLF